MAKKRGNSGLISFFLLAIIVILSIFLTGGLTPILTHKNFTSPGLMVDTISPPSKKDSLQLRTLEFKECSSRATVELLIDRSGSMEYGNKMTELRNAVKAFASMLSDTSLIGIESFARYPTEDLPISFYGEVKDQVGKIVDSITPNGPTYMRDAFIFSKDILSAAISKYPDREFVLVFVSDGIPETDPRPEGCIELRCFAEEQSPIKDPSVADEIKNMGVRIFSIAILDEKDSKFNEQLTNLLKEVASPNSFYTAPRPIDLNNIYKEIGEQICE